jgi:carbamoylphosphate synthase small subunit
VNHFSWKINRIELLLRVCFNTGMTGSRDFTDPSYYGQLMVTTNAHNYGVNEK